MRIQLDVHATIGQRPQVDRWFTDDGYSTARGTDGMSCVVTLVNGTDRRGRGVNTISYGQCWRIVASEIADGS